MEKIVFIEQGIDPEEKGLKMMEQIAREKNAEIHWLLVLESGNISSLKEKGEKLADKYNNSLNVEKELFFYRSIEYSPSNLLNSLNELSPMNLIVTSQLNLEPLSEEGIKELEDLSLRYKCPVIALSALMPEEKKSKTKLLTKTLFFGGLSVCSYFLFFPQLDKLNHAIYMKGTIVGAIAVMITVPIHAYIYGSFTESLPKLLGLEKSTGIEH